MMDAQIVVVDWKDVVGGSPLQDELERAYGPSGTGIIAIRGVPGFCDAKEAFLPMASHLIKLPEDQLKKIEDEASLYNAGWSFGKEKLGDEPDYSKGSFYYNPLTDVPGSQADRESYPLSYPVNKWPDIDGFKDAATTIGKIMKEAVVALTVHVDRLAKSKLESYPTNYLYEIMKDTEKAKARLLYYYPLHTDSNTEDSWIGWHNDSGFFTALAGDLYVDHASGKVVDCPDPNAGLYVVDRQDRLLHVTIPPDCLAIQIGECTQIVTGGCVAATPHCVRGISGHNVARISLPCFIDTPPTFVLETPTTRKDVLNASMPTAKVPPLEKRWEPGMTFGDFLSKTFRTYYDWKS